MKELYERYKGYKAVRNYRTGTICGYNEHHLIMHLYEGQHGWYNHYNGFISFNEFWYVEVTDIIHPTFKFGK